MLLHIGVICSCQYTKPLDRDCISRTPRNFGRVVITNFNNVPEKAIKNTIFSEGYSHEKSYQVKKGIEVEQLLNIIGEPLHIQIYSNKGITFHNYDYTERKKSGDFVEIFIRISNDKVIGQYAYLNTN